MLSSLDTTPQGYITELENRPKKDFNQAGGIAETIQANRIVRLRVFGAQVIYISHVHSTQQISDSELTQAIANNYIWLGKFTTFDEAYEKAQKFNSSKENLEVSAGFKSEQWKKRQIGMYEGAMNGLWPRVSTLPEQLQGLNKVEVIDLGGGSGWIYWKLVNEIETEKLTYINLELPSTVQAFNELSSNIPNFTWVSDYKKIEEASTDRVLYSNSCLQYFPDSITFCDIVQHISPEIIILDDLMLTDGPDWFSLQNYFGYLQVNKFMGRQEFIDRFQKMGYVLKGSKQYPVEFNKKMIPRIILTENIEMATPSAESFRFVKELPFESF